MRAVFDVPTDARTKLEEVLRDDLLSRQSLVVREASALGLSDLQILLVVEGSEAGVARARQLLESVAKELSGERAEEVHRRVRDQEEDVASGVGLIFGD